MIRQAVNIFSIPELRKKVLFTLGAIVIYRLGSYMPIPGTSTAYLQQIISQTNSVDASGGYLGFIAAITGGSMHPFLFCLGVMPYISASIVIQLLTTVVPSLEKLAKEGDVGRKKITEYTRYLTVLLCLVQGAILLSSSLSSTAGGMGWNQDTSGPGRMIYFLTAVLGITGGTIFLMWLGEQIDEFGIGNGASLIIMAGIIDRLPAVVHYLATNGTWSLTESSGAGISAGVVILLIMMFVGVVLGTVAVTQGQRRIPLQQARQIRGRRVYGSAQRTYLPLRVNQAGVIPVIFASSLLIIPAWVIAAVMKAPFFQSSSVLMRLHDDLNRGGLVYVLLYIGLIFVFCYFWTAIQFQPNEIANNLRDHGSFIPGMRPGSRTSDYLEKVMNRITYVGSAFLAGIAIIPMLVSDVTGVQTIMTGFLGGTGLLIIVGVALDLVQRIESHLIMRHYEGFLSSGRIHGRQG
jgi:preprotein translocase subunit SecY